MSHADKKNSGNFAFMISHEAPSAIDFKQIRESVGWSNLESLIEIEQSIRLSLFWVSVYNHQDLVACGRVIGDGLMYFYLQDIIVHPAYQGLGIGHLMMNEIEQWLLAHTKKGATIGLLAAKGKEAFYAQYGYQMREGSLLGLGMCKFI
ncbi:GNAT family N-acetyltransferase [Pseudoalteromonas xiamenensis]|uniref:GNAT family N-acetyltransferase n=1 Tax=Pseudoalteromonas xiamenensis TaxID=882626 RepID=UPI0027E4FD12|nr:GNAT family N-acetyltransferase [Pseudoalteromonas xiamenensis]WMN59947.1 GNAT family N-acetyltransferase [Pseudoalteromonas xiamenensis]